MSRITSIKMTYQVLLVQVFLRLALAGLPWGGCPFPGSGTSPDVEVMGLNVDGPNQYDVCNVDPVQADLGVAAGLNLRNCDLDQLTVVAELVYTDSNNHPGTETAAPTQINPSTSTGLTFAFTNVPYTDILDGSSVSLTYAFIDNAYPYFSTTAFTWLQTFESTMFYTVSTSNVVVNV